MSGTGNRRVEVVAIVTESVRRAVGRRSISGSRSARAWVQEGWAYQRTEWVSRQIGIFDVWKSRRVGRRRIRFAHLAWITQQLSGYIGICDVWQLRVIKMLMVSISISLRRTEAEFRRPEVLGDPRAALLPTAGALEPPPMERAGRSLSGVSRSERPLVAVVRL